MMYEKLVNRLRKASGPAIDFPDTLYDEAADSIEELNKRIDFLMNCIYEAEDALDRGTDNEWARAALEKAERGQDDV